VAKLTLDDDETKKLLKWNEDHLKDCHGGKEPYAGAIGGRLTYHLTHTGLGTVVKVVCAFCLDKPGDLTDYDSW
jgi:hypothetical protein